MPRPRWNNLSTNTPVTTVLPNHILSRPDIRYKWPYSSERQLRELPAKGERAGEGSQRGRAGVRPQHGGPDEIGCIHQAFEDTHAGFAV
jgi:hypothetical protein